MNIITWKFFDVLYLIVNLANVDFIGHSENSDANRIFNKLDVDYKNVNKELILDDSLDVNTYPTVFIFKRNKIIFRESGYSEENLHKIDSVLKSITIFKPQISLDTSWVNWLVQLARVE